MEAILCQVIAAHHNAVEIFSDKDKSEPDEKSYLTILKIGEHLAGLSRTIGNNETDIEWQKINESVLEYTGMSQYDFEDLAGYAADSGIGGQAYFM